MHNLVPAYSAAIYKLQNTLFYTFFNLNVILCDKKISRNDPYKIA